MLKDIHELDLKKFYCHLFHKYDANKSLEFHICMLKSDGNQVVHTNVYISIHYSGKLHKKSQKVFKLNDSVIRYW